MISWNISCTDCQPPPFNGDQGKNHFIFKKRVTGHNLIDFTGDSLGKGEGNRSSAKFISDPVQIFLNSLLLSL